MTIGAGELECRLLAAHVAGEPGPLSELYAQAADLAEAAGERDRAAFYLTHAWIFALDAGLPAADELRERLRAWGRC